MKKFAVTARRIPTAYNPSEGYIIEAKSATDAVAILRDHLRDWDHRYVIDAKEYVPPPEGRIVGRIFE